MKIIVKNQVANSFIDTEDACITEVFDMFIGALIQEGFTLDSINKELEVRHEDFQSLKNTSHEG